jgi:quinol monooxygenase YgiN
MIALVVRFDLLDEEAAARFDALAGELIARIGANEPGALVYASHTVDGEPLARVFYEAYVDRDAFRAHQDAEHTKAFLAARTPLLAGRRMEVLTPVVTTGLAGGR